MKDRYAYLLFGVNLILGALVVFVVPKVFEDKTYSLILIHLFGLQFASLIESGSILFFTNLVSAKAISINNAYSTILMVSRVQIIVGLVSSVSYVLLNLETDLLYTGLFIASHVVFSLIIVPRLFMLSIYDGYEKVQMYKALQAAMVACLAIIQLLFYQNPNFLIYAYSFSSLMTLFFVSIFETYSTPSEKVPLVSGLIYTIKIMSSSVGWLFISFLMGNFLSNAANPRLAQNWVIFRTADTLLGARFANRLSEYLQSFSGAISYQKSALSVLSREFKAILCVLVSTVCISWWLTGELNVFIFSVWLVLNRVNSAINIFILPDYSWKNIFNLAILLASGGVCVFLIGEEGPDKIILIMWICLVCSNVFFKKPNKEFEY